MFSKVSIKSGIVSWRVKNTAAVSFHYKVLGETLTVWWTLGPGQIVVQSIRDFNTHLDTGYD